MTSKLTRERLEKIAAGRVDARRCNDDEITMARMALAAMDGEPVAWRWRSGPDRRWHLARSGDLAGEVEPLYRHAQPAPEYPETLPCPVLLEPGLRFGKGIKTSTMLAALARRSVHESDMAALSPEERAEFQARIEDFKALIAQPAPVAQCPYPCGWDTLNKLAIQDAAFVSLALVAGEPATESIRQAAITNSDRLLKVISACRAATLAAAAQPQNAPQNIPEIIPGWIPVSDRVPEVGGDMIVFTDGIVMSGVSYAKKKGFYIQALEYDDDEPVDGVTHWMPLPAPPKEVK